MDVGGELTKARDGSIWMEAGSAVVLKPNMGG